MSYIYRQFFKETTFAQINTYLCVMLEIFAKMYEV